VPILDQDKKYLGVINKKDILFILKENKYELLSEQSEKFLNYVQQEKKCYNSTANEGTQMFQEGDSVI
jgi:predicted transcriptional regulator